MDLLEFELDNEKYIYLNGTGNFIFKSDQVNPFFFWEDTYIKNLLFQGKEISKL